MKYHNLIHAVTILVYVTLCLGCSSSQNNWPSVKISELPVEEMMTEWRTDVEAALSEAAKANKPILIYWGATWCQPCNHLKGQIIQHPAFETDTEEWAKIYIDGDSLGAQAWGEKFGIINYPTVLLLDPTATERQRFSEVIRYADFKARLSRAQGEAVDFENLVKRALTGEATEAEWNAVALGARDHYQLRGFYDTSLLEKLIPLYKRCPRLESIDCDVLAYAVITAALEAPAHSERGIDALQDIPWLHLWNQLANSSEMAIRYASHFQYIPGSLLTRLALFEEQRDIAATLPGLVATFHKLFKDEALSRKIRHNAGVAFYQLSKAIFPEKDFSDKWFRDWETLASAPASESDKRLIFPTLVKFLVKAGRAEEAEILIKRELSDDPSAWYQFYLLARSTAKLGDIPAATRLLKESWTLAPGRTTLLQVISHSATTVAKFPKPERCLELKDIQGRWTALLKTFSLPLRNRDKLAEETMAGALAGADCPGLTHQ